MNIRYAKIIAPYVILVIMLSLCTIGIASSFLYERYAKIELQSYKHNLIDAQYAQVFDWYDFDGNPSIFELFEEKDSLQRLKGFNHDLNKYFNFYEVDYQQVAYVAGYYKGSPKFVEGYDRGEGGFINQKIPKDNGFYYYTPLETAEIGLRAMREFDLAGKVEKGRCFTEAEYSVTTKLKEIPVLLGYEYEEFYDLGDQMEVTYLEFPVTLNVIGFLQKDSYYPYGNSTMPLDRKIVMPFFEFSDQPNGNYALAQKEHYSNKNGCYIGFGAEDNTAEMKKTLDELCKKYDLVYMVRFPEDLDKPIKASQLTVMKQTKKMIRIYSIAFFAIVSLVIVSLMIKHVDLNKKRYAIYLISGSGLLRLKARLFGMVGLIYSLGYVISFLVIWRLMNKLFINPEFLKTLLIPIGEVYVIIALLVMLLINRCINKTNFADALRQR